MLTQGQVDHPARVADVDSQDQVDHQGFKEIPATPISLGPPQPEVRLSGDRPQSAGVPNAKRPASPIHDLLRVKQLNLVVTGLLMDCFVSKSHSVQLLCRLQSPRSS
jgi:hypothetical protein